MNDFASMDLPNRYDQVVEGVLTVARDGWRMALAAASALIAVILWVQTAQAQTTNIAEVTAADQLDEDSTPDNRDVASLEDDTAEVTIYPAGFLVQKNRVGVQWDPLTETHIFDFQLRGVNSLGKGASIDLLVEGEVTCS